MKLAYVFLFGAIVCEILATNALKMTAGFTRLVPTMLTVVGYACAFYLLGLSLKNINLGVAYAIWAGVGIVLTAIIAYFLFHEKLDFAAMLGIGMIVAGVVIMNVFSKTVAH